MQVNAINSFSNVNFQGRNNNKKTQKKDANLPVVYHQSRDYMKGLRGPVAAIMFLTAAASGPTSCDKIEANASAIVNINPGGDKEIKRPKSLDSLNYYRYIIAIPVDGEYGSMKDGVITRLYGESDWDYRKPAELNLNLKRSSEDIAYYDYTADGITKAFPFELMQAGNNYSFYTLDGDQYIGLGVTRVNDIAMHSKDGNKVVVYQYQTSGKHKGGFEEIGTIEPGYLSDSDYNKVGTNVLLRKFLNPDDPGTDYHYVNVKATLKDIDEVKEMAKNAQ